MQKFPTTFKYGSAPPLPYPNTSLFERDLPKYIVWYTNDFHSEVLDTLSYSLNSPKLNAEHLPVMQLYPYVWLVPIFYNWFGSYMPDKMNSLNFFS